MNNSDRIYYNTEEFSVFEKNAKVSYEQAYDIYLDYVKNEDIYLEPVFLFCSGKDYVFGVSTNPQNDKMNRSWKLYKLKINSQTGEIERIEGQVK
ncbi:hypothetical protein [Chryseobacterium salviniae]|uniref:Uncharacterized protein n=1 Tax=Chryseobacterium salviniae TaxID=3101750 RepID=A0ABU6HP20_9FLAO|nr:hypothetical protein [Chryseobacterium sp. T9W2-O]MEC3874208.1 hypothetical protein [Chryseobacterium sp. T9W2-O]